jgi:PTS system nitrogen regulatory IIA component
MSLHRLLARLTLQTVAAKISISCSKKLFEQAGLLLAPDASDNEETLSLLLTQREKLGSTGVGDGVAIPHAVSPQVDVAALSVITLAHGLSFDAPDQKEVDVFFFVVLPDHALADNEMLLKKIAKLSKNETLLQGIRSSQNNQQLYQSLLMATVLEHE